MSLPAGPVSRTRLVEVLEQRVGLDEFDMEDVGIVIDVLLEAFTPGMILTYMLFPAPDLSSTPVLMIHDGRMRDVLSHARGMVLNACRT